MVKLITLEYEQMPVNFTGDAWFNATKVAEKFGKEPHEWLRLPETIKYLAALQRNSGKIPELRAMDSGYVRTMRGRGGGTWLHPRLGVIFARWLDVDFSIWCDIQIDRILRGGLGDWRRSTVQDRLPMQHKVLDISVDRRVSPTVVQGNVNRYMGVRRSRYASMMQLEEGIGLCDRYLSRTETAEDQQCISDNHATLYGESRQLSLLKMDDMAAPEQ